MLWPSVTPSYRASGGNVFQKHIIFSYCRELTINNNNKSVLYLLLLLLLSSYLFAFFFLPCRYRTVFDFEMPVNRLCDLSARTRI